MDIQREIHEWTRSLPGWQRDLLRRLCLSEPLDSADEEAILALLRHEHKVPGASAVAAIPVKLEQIPAPSSAGNSPRILAVGPLQNVNVIDPGQTLTFESRGLTVVYGSNGSGKSGYSRVLKKACRPGPRDDEILPNIFDGAVANTPRTATLVIELGGERRERQRQVNAPPEPELSSISVFDSRAAALYVDSKNQVIYLPAGLELFSRLAQAQGRLQERVQAEIAAVQLHPLVFAEPAFTPPTRVKALLDALNAGTPPDEVRALATLSVQDERRFEELQRRAREVRVDPAIRSAGARRSADRLGELRTALAALLRDCGAGLLAQLRAASEALAAAEDVAKRVDHLAPEDAAVPGLNLETWSVLWEAARAFIGEAFPGRPFPPRGGANECPLCRQPLSPEAVTRLERFEEHANRVAARRVEESRSELDERLAELTRLGERRANLATSVASRAMEEPALAGAVAQVLASVEGRLQGMARAVQEGRWDDVPALANGPLDALAASEQALRAEAAEWERLIQPEARARDLRELEELEARRALAARLDDVLRHLEKLRTVAALHQAHRALRTDGITARLKKLMGETVTRRLTEGLAREMKALKVTDTRARLVCRGSRGNGEFFLEFDGTSGRPLSSVLSEGEQRALSLACFLAEIGAADHDGGILLDDPMTSLDLERRRHVAERLVEEARKRQVIVFTHDAHFLTELLELAELQNVPLETRSVHRFHQRVGLVDTELPWTSKPVAKRLAHLRHELHALVQLERAGEPAAYADKVATWLLRLRQTWERLVEEKVFNGAVTRFDRAVHTRKLRPMAFSQELVQAIRQGMTDVSFWMHDQPVSLDVPIPSSGELAGQLAKLEAALALADEARDETAGGAAPGGHTERPAPTRSRQA